MLALLDQVDEPFVADEAEAEIAKIAADRLHVVARAGHDIQLFSNDPRVVVPLPARAVDLITRILEAMSQRQPFSLIPHEAELTTQQAADFLNVSRPYLIGLVDSGKIKHRVVGRHRRILFADLLEYETRSKAERKAALAEMADEARRLNLE